MMENLSDCDGYRFECLIHGDPVVGHISVNGSRVYLCQDSKNGVSEYCLRMFGHRYGWFVYEGSSSDLEANHVSDFHLLARLSNCVDIEGYSNWQVGDVVCNGISYWVVIFRSGPLVVVKARHCEDTELYTCTGLHDAGFRLHLGEDLSDRSPVVVPKAEIASRKGVDVSRIKVED